MQNDDTNRRDDRLLALGRLSASLVHDWNNLLTLMAAQVAEIEFLAKAGHAPYESALELSQTFQHAAEMPRSLLAFLRDEPGQFQTASLNQVILDAQPLLILILGPKAACHFDLAPGLPDLSLDRPLLIQALINLAGNAREAMDASGGRLTLRTRPEPGAVVLEAEDNGRGMDQSTRERLFEPFFSTRLQNGGSGLGLQTVQRLVEAHGAAIEVASTPGQGTTFRLRFPSQI